MALSETEMRDLVELLRRVAIMIKNWCDKWLAAHKKL